MAPKWPQVNNGPEHINEHATYLREACKQLQAVDKGRQNQVPWNIVQKYLESTIALVGKVLQQPPMSDILHHVQDAVKCTQNIQKDVSIIKNSVGLSSTPPNATNFTGGKQVASWAQVARGRGNPIPPPPAAQGTPTTKAKPTVTAYKDRAIIVKLKDHRTIQRFRVFPAAEIKQHVEASIKSHTATKSVAVVAAHQLKSGDIQIFTSSVTGAEKLKENRSWVKGLGEQAELVVPTYGVIVHGIPTNTINVKDQETTIQQILADNHTVIPKAEISHVGWLTRESPSKSASAIVVEFKEPEMANAIIYASMVWDGQLHSSELYDRACRVKQCFRCYRYGHIGTQCSAAQTCGYCAELHETKNCPQKGAEGFNPRCPVCKGTHTAWSNACPERKKELERIEQAKRNRPTYWPVPPKDRPSEKSTENNNPRKRRQARDPTPDRVITIESPREESPDQVTTQGIQAPRDTTGQTRDNTPTAEGCIAPPQEHAPQPPAINSPLFVTEQSLETDPAAGDIPTVDPIEVEPMGMPPTQQPELPLDTFGEFNEADADEWLANLADVTENWPHDPPHDPGTVESFPTSMATNTRTANGNIYRSCRCPEHQDIYTNWPTEDAELRIAHCMRVCMYCGKDFALAAELRRHIRRKREYLWRNLTVQFEGKKHNALTPEWTPRP